MFNLFTSYNTRTAKIEDKRKLKQPPLLTVNENGIIVLTKLTKKFIVRETVYTRYNKDCVINQCPYVTLNDSDERSCFSTLLLHTVWPIEGEINALHGLGSAIECLHRLKLENKIPHCVKNAVESINNSHVLRSNTGCKEPNITSENEEDDNDMSDEEDDDILDESDRQIGNQNGYNKPIEPFHITDGKNIIPNISARYKEYYTNIIKNSQEDFINKMKAENQIDNFNEGGKNTQFNKDIKKYQQL
jgi:hypothetical protein